MGRSYATHFDHDGIVETFSGDVVPPKPGADN
jgi:hypothetical protein